jgi:hypothetical protein
MRYLFLRISFGLFFGFFFGLSRLHVKSVAAQNKLDFVGLLKQNSKGDNYKLLNY